MKHKSIFVTAGICLLVLFVGYGVQKLAFAKSRSVKESGDAKGKGAKAWLEPITDFIDKKPVIAPAPALNQILKWDGAKWIPATDETGTGADNDWSGIGTGKLYPTTITDKVGIGTATPAYKLDVTGDIKVTGGIHDGTNFGASGQVLKTNGSNVYWANDETGTGVPPGAIIMWSGTLASIPAGWHLCDGTGGTPNLSDRFIYGVHPGENPGATGGADSYALTVAQLPAHSHTGTTNSAGNHSHSGSTDPAGGHTHTGSTNTTGSHTHTGSTNSAGAHTHTYYSFDGDPGAYDYFVSGSVNDWKGKQTSSAGSHSHTLNINSAGSHSHTLSINAVGDHTHGLTINSAGSHWHSFTTDATGSGASIDNRPAYYKLAFIMKL